MAEDTPGPTVPEGDRVFDTTTSETNRSIAQGNGVGAKELDAQGEPTETAEHDPFKESPDAAEAARRAEG